MKPEHIKIHNAAIAKALKQIPTSWLDPMLTGKEAVIGKPPWGCPEIERVLQATAERIGKLKVKVK